MTGIPHPRPTLRFVERCFGGLKRNLRSIRRVPFAQWSAVVAMSLSSSRTSNWATVQFASVACTSMVLARIRLELLDYED